LEWALAAARRATALNDSWHWGHLALGYAYLFQRQYDQALAETERGVALNPDEATSWAILAQMFSLVGRSEEALQKAE